MLTSWKENYDQPRQHIKKQRHYFANKGLSRQGYGFSSSHVWIWELDCEESWALKNWCFWTVVLEKTLESPLDCKEIQPAHPRGDQSWVFIGRTDVEAETPILWPPDAKETKEERNRERKKVKSLSHVWLFATLWTVAYQSPPSMGFSRQEYWSGLPFPSPGDLPNSGIEPRSPALQADTLPSELPGKPKSWLTWKDPDAGKGWSQEEKGTTEDEMIGWHYWLDGQEFG